MESRCRYTGINGARCAMPALNRHDLCFQNQQRKRQAQRKPAPFGRTSALFSNTYLQIQR